MDVVDRREELLGLLGRLPSRTKPIQAQLLEEQEHRSYILEKLVLDLNDREPVPAYFLRAKHATPHTPVMLYNHSHGGRYAAGKEELLSPAPYMYAKSYAESLTELGFSVLAIDAWAFGERSSRSEATIFKELLWQGRTMWGMMVFDSLRAVDYLVSRADVDPARIGTLGMSMGSTMSWWLAALDPRIQVTVDICCLTDFETLLEEGGIDRHGLFYYVPDLLNHFTTAQINALIAPRPHLSLAGNLDPLTPVKGLDKIDHELRSVYTQLHASESWRLSRYDVAHLETKAMRDEVIAYLQAWLDK
ncbi:dienelactone hydrolase family protein [Paenibacillus whitsoniae]|uniref:Alpha/beta hydrolase n=1 Tax=Paenibacillus whitsoniae TaxID=2496558 RepID=A0A430JGS4_9BACL|nr:dienelactone hydrolase family protein [Paenibacillus whitsoniae]RTE10210.1 alpha/beta hydrolase [Paenibacillus whitsoniae]